ncbi:MAG: hypothetical protein FWD42_06820 [Solirubrobacterales bacterium]|nr:hypothetical protein [Solirubrobacterales bacterium]
MEIVVGCNLGCALYAHGHLSLRSHHRNMRLGSVRMSLAPSHAVRIALALSRGALAAVRAASRGRRHVEALIWVGVSAPGQSARGYLVRVRLSYR